MGRIFLGSFQGCRRLLHNGGIGRILLHSFQGKKVAEGVMLLVSHLFPSDNAIGALGGLSAPFLLKKDMAFSTEKISQNYTQRQTVREVQITHESLH